MTPRAIEVKWLGIEDKFATQMAKKSDFWRLLAIGLLGFLLLYFTRDWWNNNYPDWANFYAASVRFDLIFALGLFTYLTPLIRHPSFLVLAMTAAWSYNLYRIHTTNPLAFFYPAYFVLSYIFLRVALKWNRPALWALSLLTIVGGFVTVMYSAGKVGIESGSTILELFWILHPEYALFSLVYLWVFSRGKNWQAQSELAMVPSQIVNSLPIPVGTKYMVNDPERLKYLWWLGYSNMLQSLLLFFTAMGIALIPKAAQPVLAAAHQYLYFAVFISAAMGMATSLIRMYGFDAQPACRFLFFAESPLDVWRRGSAYMYQMVLDLIFIPMMRLTKSLFLTSSVCALFIVAQMLLMHEFGVKAFYSILFAEFDPYIRQMPHALWAATYFAGGWIALIVGYHYVLESRLNHWGKPGFSWGRIVVTHILVILLMSMILK